MLGTRFTREVRQVVATADTEARLRHDARVGTEHLLVALLHDPLLSERYLGGRTASAGRQGLDELCSAALRSAGVEPPEPPPISAASRGHLDFTHGAKQALERTLRIARGRRANRIEPRDLLMAIASETGPSTALDLLHELALEPVAIISALHEA